ncbi:MAG TPA: hypothetical protein VFV49_06525, partial [Thermoanaerobaculia bacterium]|nr:hypothetical protein [Thermoanaerobaculia bacterium]
MSRGEDPDQAVRELLQKYEKEEAAVLRAELVDFLKSPEVRAELEKTVQKPLEAIVLSALSNAKFQEQIRDAVMAALKPELVKAAQSAATSALGSIKVSLPEEAQRRMRTEAEEALRNAFATAQREALATVPRLANESRRQMQARSEDWPESESSPRASTQRVAPRLASDRTFWAAVAAVVLILGAASYWLLFRRSDDRADPTDYVETASVTETLPTETAVDIKPVPSLLLQQYREALMQMGPPALPAPTAAQVACVENALPSAETARRLDVAALRKSLNNCAATSGRPSG